MNRSQNNVFTTPGLCVITGEIRKAAKQPNANQFSRKSAAERTAATLALRTAGGVHITSQDESDRTRSIKFSTPEKQKPLSAATESGSLTTSIKEVSNG